MTGFKDQLPLAPLAQILQQRTGQQTGQGLGLGHLTEDPDCLASTFSAVHGRTGNGLSLRYLSELVTVRDHVVL